MKVYIIIPAYNESQTLPNVIRELLDFGYENIVVVDDGSKDNTYKLIRDFNIHTLQHIINRGQGAALKTGTNYALMQGADIIVHFDADGQMRVQDIETLVKPLIEEDYDIVMGSRFLGAPQNMPLKRKVLLKGAKTFNKVFLGINMQDPQSGFRALSRESAKTIKIKHDRMAHCSQILQDIIKKDLKVKEVPVTINYTEYSLQKGQKSTDALKIVLDLFLRKIIK